MMVPRQHLLCNSGGLGPACLCLEGACSVGLTLILGLLHENPKVISVPEDVSLTGARLLGS